MPTNDERREVAERLRIDVLTECNLTDGELLDELTDIVMPSGPSFTSVEDYDAAFVNRLADLIEPEERTCHNVFEGKTASGLPIVGPFTCSECGEHTKTWVHIGFGDMAVDDPKFCPSCGAKVMHDE